MRWCCTCGAKSQTTVQCKGCGKRPPEDYLQKERAKALIRTKAWQQCNKDKVLQSSRASRLKLRDRLLQRQRSGHQVHLAAAIARRLELKSQLSGRDGKNPQTCEYVDSTTQNQCDVPIKFCHLHHVDRTRKKFIFSACRTVASVEKEIARNTAEDGTILLRTLCPLHHEIVDPTFTGQGHPFIQDAREAVNNIKRSMSTCKHDKCYHPGVVCVKGNEHLFDLDHIFDAKSAVPDEVKKVMCVAQFVNRGKKDLAVQEARKCRLLHKSCHLDHTAQQLTTKNAWVMEPSNAKAVMDMYPELGSLIRAAGIVGLDQDSDHDVLESGEISAREETSCPVLKRKMTSHDDVPDSKKVKVHHPADCEDNLD